MHVRRLNLQGFKTFASKTAFEFNRGITAVVGPNGSGKSNLADALRWVLGEQSYSTLRGRRTEDVIFSGTSSRAPVGMAEVSLLLDNEDGELALDAPEVEIARRAYRSGNNEYYINRRRVRLQDVEQVLGGLTSSYVVIHQGLVDEALSLRPRDRRLLLEEAAEVRRYHERRRKAQERMEDTAANMTRVADLRGEIAPRLRVLQRQSQQARQWNEVQTALHHALRAWYRLLWEEASLALEQALAEERAVQEHLRQARAGLEEAELHAAGLRQALQESRRRQEEERQREGELHRRETALRQEQAQAEGEKRALQRYCQELQPEIERWQEESARQEERRRSSEEALLSLDVNIGHLQAEVQAREAALRQAELDLQAVQGERLERERRLQDMAATRQEAERRLESLSTRQDVLQREARERREMLEELRGQEERAREEQSAVAGQQAGQEQAWTQLLARAGSLRAEVSQVQESHRSIIAALEQSRVRLAETRARLEALSRGSAQSDGASFLQQWARREGRADLVSVLDLLTIPTGLEAAVEAALGLHAGALLPADWDEAALALEALTAAAAGRATLLPRAALRPPERPATDPESEGYLLEHLSAPAEAAAGLDCLLGRVLLAADREAARRIAGRLPAGWVVVTRQGEALFSEGLLRGGRVPAGRGTLALERERQGLVRAVREAETACGEHEQAQAEVQRQRAALERDLAELNRRREELRLAREGAARRVEELDRELARLAQEDGRHRQRLEALQQEEAGLADEEADLRRRLQELQSEQDALHERVWQDRQSEQAAQEAYTAARDLWQETRTAWAVAQKEQENQCAWEEMARRNAGRLEQQIAEGRQRLQAAMEQIARWQERGATLEAQISEVAAESAALLAAVAPPALSADEMARWDERVVACRQQVLEGESAAAHAAVEEQRAHDRLREVLRRGLADIGPDAEAYGAAGEALLDALVEAPPEWARLPLDPEISSQECERRIAQLREEVRRLGPVNPLAEEEYREAQERYDFLGRQLQDLTEAGRSLQQVIAELDQAMEERFQETFEAVNREFQSYFARLFGGGTASLRLVQLEEDGGLTGLGVEIVARPPGKRAHSLALLSGGERALTSTALLFAILKANPRPFCLLDEVDAMLDEANVGRFRECLEELAAQTQFIVITHNRGTVQAASALYGVSMADDGTSRVLSLRLEDS